MWPASGVNSIAACPGETFSMPGRGSLRMVKTNEVLSDSFQLRWFPVSSRPFMHIGTRWELETRTSAVPVRSLASVGYGWQAYIAASSSVTTGVVVSIDMLGASCAMCRAMGRLASATIRLKHIDGKEERKAARTEYYRAVMGRYLLVSAGPNETTI